MQSRETSTLRHTDPLLSIYRMFARLQGLQLSGSVEIVPEDQMADCTLEKVNGFGSDMIFVPWVIHSSSSISNIGSDGWQSQTKAPKGNVTHNPFDSIFVSTGKDGTIARQETRAQYGFWPLAQGVSITHTPFIRNVFSRSDVDVGLYIDQSRVISTPFRDSEVSLFTCEDVLGFPLDLNASVRGRGSAHIFLPFVGGPDDRLALEFVVGLCRRNESLRATVLRLRKVDGSGRSAVIQTAPGEARIEQAENAEVTVTTMASDTPGIPDTVYAQPTTELRMKSGTADNIVWARYATPQFENSSSTPSVKLSADRVSRVVFKEISTTKPLHAALNEAIAIHTLSGRQPKGSVACSTAMGIVVVAGRSRRLAAESHSGELKELMQEDNDSGMVRAVTKTVGEISSAFIGRRVGVGILVLQLALRGDR